MYTILQDHHSNKLKIIIFRDSYRVVGFEVETYSVDKNDLIFIDESCQYPTDPKPQLVNEDTGTKLYFTYSIEWSESDVSWASRWDIYLGMKDVQIHWFSIVNSIVVLFFLSGIQKNMILLTDRHPLLNLCDNGDMNIYGA